MFGDKDSNGRLLNGCDDNDKIGELKKIKGAKSNE
jgi:hypothetical protein